MSAEAPRRWRIDPNVRLGDLISAAVVAIGLAGAYFTLAGRVDANERVQSERDATQDMRLSEFKSTVRDNLTQIRNDVSETRQDVKEIGRFIRKGG